MQGLQIKGVMLDMARVTEKHSYYDSLLPRLASWGYNTIFAHFTDDEGCAMQFKRRPALATPHAYTQDEMRDWVRKAARHGLTVIPEIESFGHTNYIHDRKKYRHLREPIEGCFNAINPLARETHAILADVVAETAEVFDAPFIHMGLDEVNFGASRQVIAALKKKEKWQLFAEHVCRMHKLVTKAGRRMMMWGDHLLSEPRIADAIPKDIVICDWHYQRDVAADTVRFFTKRGFDVICCPASNRSHDMILPNAVTQINLQRFARIAHAGPATAPGYDTLRRDERSAVTSGRRVMGLMNTVWCPQRMLCGNEQFAMALGGAWFNDPEADPREVVATFVKDMFGVSGTASVAKAILKLSAIMPVRQELRPLLDSDKLPAQPLTALECEHAGRMAADAEKLAAVFHARKTGVKTNAALYGNYALAAELLNWACRIALARTDGSLNKTHLKEGKKLLARCIRDWNRGRHASDPKRDLNGNPGRWPGALIPNLHLSLTRLAKAVK